MTHQGPDRIMVVDDDPDILSIARIALETMGGFAVDTCSCGHEAVNRVAVFKPDMILLDAMMPEMSGPETIQAMINQYGAQLPPVVFFTGRVQAEDVAAFKQLGAVGIVEKPFDPVSLAGKVQDIWVQNLGSVQSAESQRRERAG